MARIPLFRLEHHLLGAADVLRGSVGPSVHKEYIIAMLCPSHGSDHFDVERAKIIAAQRCRASWAMRPNLRRPLPWRLG